MSSEREGKGYCMKGGWREGEERVKERVRRSVMGPVRNPVLYHRVAPCFPWFLSFGNRTQNSRVAGASPTTSPSGNPFIGPSSHDLSKTAPVSVPTPRWTVRRHKAVCASRASSAGHFSGVCVYYCRTYSKAVCGGMRGTVKDMCYEVRRAEACVD